MTYLNAIKINLKRLRLAHSLSQEELAQRLHVVRQTVSSWENGKTEPDLDTLMAIALALNVDVGQLLYGAKPFDPFISERPVRIRRTVFLLFASVGIALLALFWQDILHLAGIFNTAPSDFNVRAPKSLLYLFCASILPSCAYLLSSITFFSFLGIWWPFTVSSCVLRKTMLFIGYGTFLLYLLFILGIIGSTSLPLSIYYFYIGLYRRQYLFLLSGALIELGMRQAPLQKFSVESG